MDDYGRGQPLNRLILFYLHYQLNPRYTLYLRVALFSSDLMPVAGSDMVKTLLAAVQHAFTEQEEIILHLGDLSQAAMPVLSDEKIIGCLAVSTTTPKFFMPERVQLMKMYADLCVLALEARL